MRGKRLGITMVMALATVLVASAGMTRVMATSSSSSTNYEATEMQFGAGSSLESCSEGYCSKVSIGGLGGGAADAGAAGNKVTFGKVIPDEPMLEVIINSGVSNLGELTAETTATKTMTVQIRSYLSEGYTLQVNGEAPKYGSRTLATPSTPTASTPGTEQFAINVVANTEPEIGQNIEQHPSSEFSFGEVLADYATPNLFMYNSGDVISQSLVESGRTDYTISMIVNIASSTPAGNYNGDFSAVVVPVF